MLLLKKNSLKYKLLSFDELVINLDRLTRFKNPEYSYKRVFYSIISKYLITPKYTNKEIELLDAKLISRIVKEIWNNSVKECCNFKVINNSSFDAFKLCINNTFKNIDINTTTFINTPLWFSPILDKIKDENIPFNLKFLKKINMIVDNQNKLSINNLREYRVKYKLKYPVEKLLIVEGVTEEILLPVFAEKLNKNFDENGLFILGAGGKSKSPKLYSTLKDKLKIPMVLLFDLDAMEMCNILDEQLLKKDKYIILKKGEFEDILSPNVIKRSLNNEYEPASPLKKEDLKIHEKMCDNISEFYRTRHLGEFKKSKVAKLVAKNLKYDSDISEDIRELLSSIL